MALDEDQLIQAAKDFDPKIKLPRCNFDRSKPVGPWNWPHPYDLVTPKMCADEPTKPISFDPKDYELHYKILTRYEYSVYQAKSKMEHNRETIAWSELGEKGRIDRILVEWLKTDVTEPEGSFSKPYTLKQKYWSVAKESGSFQVVHPWMIEYYGKADVAPLKYTMED